jgi:hypothetical protein
MLHQGTGQTAHQPARRLSAGWTREQMSSLLASILISAFRSGTKPLLGGVRYHESPLVQIEGIQR